MIPIMDFEPAKPLSVNANLASSTAQRNRFRHSSIAIVAVQSHITRLWRQAHRCPQKSALQSITTGIVLNYLTGLPMSMTGNC